MIKSSIKLGIVAFLRQSCDHVTMWSDFLTCQGIWMSCPFGVEILSPGLVVAFVVLGFGNRDRDNWVSGFFMGVSFILDTG